MRNINKRPLISVLMPTYNVEKYIKKSVKSILNQTYDIYEFIIIDDGSKDRTVKIIKDFLKLDKRIILKRNRKNKGVTKSLNRGIKLANGKYIIRMDSDDWSYPERFDLQIKLMEKNPDVVVSGSFIEICDSGLNFKHIRKYQLDDINIRKRLFRYCPFAHPATIWRASILKKELYDERIEICQDYELYFRVGKIGKFMNLNVPLLKLRMHSDSVSSRMNDLQSKATILIRFNAVFLLGYNMSRSDRLYNFLQEMIIGLIPIKIRFLLFNFLRRFSFY